MVVPFQQGIDPNFDTDGYLFPAPAKVTKAQQDEEEEDREVDQEDEEEDTMDGTSTGYVISDEANPTIDTSRVTALMKRLTRRDLKLADGFGVRDWRQIQAALDTEFIHSALARVEEGQPAEINVGALQATHSGRTDVLHYGGQGLVINTVGVNVYRGSSDDHQLYFGLTPRPPREKWGGVTTPVQSSALPRSRQRASEMALEGLMKVYKSGMWLSSEQEEATISVLEGRFHNLVCVLGTGSGKTGLIVIPAKMEDHLDHQMTTIVIVPTVALAEDLVRTCREKDVCCIQYDAAFPYLHAPVVVVIADTATSEGFILYVRRLFDRKRLSRVIFDECHAIEMDADYRDKFRKLRRLEFGVQNVFLSATLPPTQYARFLRFCQIKEETTRLIRARTNRLRMRYQVRVVNDTQEALAREINSMEWEGCTKGMVFSRTTKEAEIFAARLGTLCSTVYHSHLPGKEENLQAWIDGKYHVMVATSGLGLGVNVQKVSNVFHLGLPYKMSDFVQQSGRAGRAGEDVRSTIFITQREIKGLGQRLREGGIPHDEAAAIEMILTSGCRRLIISAFMDGVDEKVGCQDLDGAVHCDNCERSHDDIQQEDGFENEVLNWESSSVAAPTPLPLGGNRKRARTEERRESAGLTAPWMSTVRENLTSGEPETEPMSMSMDEDDVPGIPQIRFDNNDFGTGSDEDYEDPDWLDAVNEYSPTRVPVNGSQIRQAAIVDEYEEDMVTIERIRELQEGLEVECRWC
jgi:superfamily II DNA or RNA helicase